MKLKYQIATIELGQGKLLEADARSLVNPINCVGAMGKGLALQLKRAFPDNFRQYQLACCAGEVQPGRMFVVAANRLLNPKYIVNFPTERHSKNPSRIEDIQMGLNALVEFFQQRDISSLAVPPLGWGNGGLDWLEIEPPIEPAFSQLTDVQVLLFSSQRIEADWMRAL